LTERTTKKSSRTNQSGFCGFILILFSIGVLFLSANGLA
jgi:hypothetical protein